MKNLFLIALSVAVLGAASCSRNIALPKDPSNPVEQLEYRQALKNNRPAWTNKGLWEEEDFIYQVGQSMIYDTEREAKKHAYRDASFRLSEYVTQQMNVEFSELIVSESESTETINQTAAAKETSKSVSKSVISTISPYETFVEVNIDGDETIGYSAFAVVKVSKKAMKVAQKMIRDQYEKTTRPPTGEIASVDNL
jgi:hypothetical protein